MCRALPQSVWKHVRKLLRSFWIDFGPEFYVRLSPCKISFWPIFEGFFKDFLQNEFSCKKVDVSLKNKNVDT